MEEVAPKKNKLFWKIWYTTTLFIGLVLMYFMLNIYNLTIIKPIILVSIILALSLVAFMLIKNHYRKTYSKNSLFYPIFQSILSWGFIACYLFMATNYYLADSTNKVYRLRIKKKGMITSGGVETWDSKPYPYIIVDYSGCEKTLDYTSAYTDKVNAADSVEITASKGAMGFDVIKGRTLIQ